MKNTKKNLSVLSALSLLIALSLVASATAVSAREAESGTGADSAGSPSGRTGGVDDGLPRNSGLDDNGLRGDGTVDDGLPRHSGLDDNGLRGDGTVDDGLPRNSGIDSARDIAEQAAKALFGTDDVLVRGARNTSVVRLQDALREDGVFHVSSTGFFGDITEQSVREFQRRHGLAVTGTIDTLTRDELNRGRGSANSGPGNARDRVLISAGELEARRAAIRQQIEQLIAQLQKRIADMTGATSN